MSFFFIVSFFSMNISHTYSESPPCFRLVNLGMMDFVSNVNATPALEAMLKWVKNLMALNFHLSVA